MIKMFFSTFFSIKSSIFARDDLLGVQHTGSLKIDGGWCFAENTAFQFAPWPILVKIDREIAEILL